MKRIQIALVALLLSTSFAMAQPDLKKHDKTFHHQGREMAYTKLNLSDDQKAKMKTANEDFKKQMQALNSNENQSVKQQRDARVALMKDHKAKMENILTSDQKAQVAQMKVDAKKSHSEMAAKHLDKMKQELALTDQQVSQLKSNQEVMKSKLEAIKNNTSLDRTAKMQQLRAARESMKNSMEQVLTPEQKEKWQGMKKNRPHPHFKRGDFKGPKPQAQV